MKVENADLKTVEIFRPINKADLKAGCFKAAVINADLQPCLIPINNIKQPKIKPGNIIIDTRNEIITNTLNTIQR